MDYDDNDTSRHNLQLAGEGRTRSSSVLRPYDFPKFDFDDTLQGHLRFDSLVETEVFLGIQSQEDNQWIEDFSRGSNGMEFNPTPADSCSISRRNNVWSEATSSESVEMLLKSVGQEEMIPGTSITPESDVTDDQGSLSRHVETSNEPQERNVVNSDTTLLPDEVLKDYPASSRHREELLENPISTLAEDKSICRNSSNFNESALCRIGGKSTNEGKHSFHDKCAGENLEESKATIEKTKNSGDVGDAVGFSSIDNVNSNIEILSTSKVSHQDKYNGSHESCIGDVQEKHDSTQTAPEDTAILDGTVGVSSVHICTTSSSLGSVRESERDNQEATLDSIRESTDTLVKTDSEPKSSEEDDRSTSCTTSIQTSRYVEILAISNEKNEPLNVSQGGSSNDGVTQHSAELGNFSSARCASTEQMIDPCVELAQKRDGDNMEDVSAIPSPVLSLEDNKVSTERGDGIGETNTGYSADMAVLSSAAEYKHDKRLEGCCNDSMGTEEVSGANLVANDMDVSIQVIHGSIVQRQDDFPESEKDICKTKEADKQISNDLENMDSENIGTVKNDYRIESLEEGEGVEGNSTVHMQPPTSGEPESVNIVSPPATINASALLADQLEVDPNALVSFDRDEAGTKKFYGANSGAEGDNAKVEFSVADGTVEIPHSKMSAKSQQPVEKVDDVCSSVPLSMGAVNSLSSDHPLVNPSCNNVIVMDSGEDHEKAMTKVEEQDAAQNAEMDKASCGSPTIISSSELSLAEKDNQEEGRSYQVTNDFVKDIQFNSEDLKMKDLAGDDSSFTFKVNALPVTSDGEPGKNWSPFPDVEKCKVVEETAPSGKGKMERTPSQKTPRKNARASDLESGPGTSKGTSERKGRRGSGKGTGKENVKKESQSKGPKGPMQENTSINEKVSSVSLSTPSSSPHVQFGQVQPYGIIEASNKKVSGVLPVPTSSLPDLNTSALNNSTTSSATFRQPFTDSQQVQLRAQIFVYGSLIQGTAPDEACMVSAFGPSGDGGRSTWEPIWRVAVERVRIQKSNSVAVETPSRSQSGARASDAIKQGSHSSKVLATPVSRTSNKDTPAAVLNPLIPLSSPLWNISTPSRDSLTSNAMHKGPVVDIQQPVTPVHSYQTPPIRNFAGHPSWPSQTSFPSPWLASPQTAAFSSSVRFHPVTMTETVKLTPVKDTPVMLTSSVKHTASSPAVQAASPSPVLGGVSPLSDPKMVASSEQRSVDSKPRKRKKVPASDNLPVSLISAAQTEAVVISDVATLPTSHLGVSAPVFRASDAILSKPAADASIDHSTKADPGTVRAVACSEETLSKVAEAKSQAEDAADLAAIAVSHCEDLWSQLGKQKDSVLTSEAEAKLASAAVAIAAAASVAKAAAAAAKIACNAALQAKLMADEAFLSSKTSGVISTCVKSSSDVHDIGNATPTSISKSNNVANQSSAILVAAKEAAKRRVEAASAASRQAENLDAIVKAAELAAAAVSQAGKIVAMGEPLPLNDLIEAGPDGYWKLPQPAVLAEKVRDGNTDQSGAISLEKAADIPVGILADSVEKGGSMIVGIDDIRGTGGPFGSLNATMNLSDNVMGSKDMDAKDFRTAIDHEASDTSKSARVAAEPDALQRTTNGKAEHDELGADAQDAIREGSLVEVFKPGNSLKSAWYSANVLSLEDGKAYICYNDLLSDEGSGNLQEWVTLEAEGRNAPTIRAAQPSSASQFQQTRKRRRDALGDYAWSVEDRVDVWIDDCWWEGVVTEKNEKDETTLKVHIPAQGETSTVRAWNLRASRSWIDGKWIEYSTSRGQNTSEQSDTPQEKRQKLGISALATKAKDKESNNVDSAIAKPEQSKFFTLSTSERTFDIGKTTNDDNKRATRRPLRTNQQKEGTGVVFGVPKPTGKKRKFMEVSKHFPANKSNKGSEVNDSVKFAKYLMPQGAATRGWKVPSRTDSKEKRIVGSKPRIISTRKANRTLPQRENFRSTVAQDAESSMDHGIDAEDHVGHDENTSDKSIEHGSDACEEAAEAPLSSLLPHSQSTTSKKISSTNLKTNRLYRGRLLPSGGKLSKIEEDTTYSADTGKSTLDSSEPRRSNRRIQPTHRLLEGLQSSMVIPKMPSVSHDKSRRNLPPRGK